MANKKQFEHIIKESFDQQSHVAPSGMWDQLSAGLDEPIAEVNVDAKIKNSFESTRSKAPEFVFSNIEKQLNIDSVWLRINRILNLDRLWFWLRNVGIGLLVLGLLFGGIQWLQPERTNSEFLVDIELPKTKTELLDFEQHNESFSKHEKPKQNTRSSIKSAHSNLSNNNNNNNNLGRNNSIDNLHKDELEEKSEHEFASNETKTIPEPDEELCPNVIFSSEGPINNEVELLKDSNLAIDTFMVLNSKAFVEFELDLETATISDSDLRIDPELSNEIGKMKFRKKSPFYIGLIASYNKSTVNNIEYRISRIRTSLIKSTPAYSYSYGVMVAYALTPKDVLVSEFYINNQYKQTISGYDEGHYYQKRTQMDYSSISLLYERKFPFVFFEKQLNLAVKIGGYCSYLKQVRETVDEVSLSTEHEFENSDYGLRFMLGQQTRISKVILDFGVNASYGFKNIYKGHVLKPAEFDRTNTYYLGIYLNLRYRL